jgi:hypothetical protein
MLGDTNRRPAATFCKRLELQLERQQPSARAANGAFEAAQPCPAVPIRPARNERPFCTIISPVDVPACPCPYARAPRRNLAGSAYSGLRKDLACPTDLKDASCDLRNFSNCPTLAIVNSVGRGGAPPGPKNAKAVDALNVHGPSEYYNDSIHTLPRTGSEGKTLQRGDIVGYLEKTLDKVRVVVSVLQNPNYSVLAKVTFTELVLGFHNTETGRCDPSAKTVGERLDRHERKIRGAIAELEAGGAVIAQQRGRTSSSYNFPGLERPKTASREANPSSFGRPKTAAHDSADRPISAGQDAQLRPTGRKRPTNLYLL